MVSVTQTSNYKIKQECLVESYLSLVESYINVANARERKIETILPEGVGLFLCSDARGREIEMLDQGWGLECCGETSYHHSDERVFR